MEKAKPLSRNIKEKETTGSNKNYPIFWHNAQMCQVRQEYAPGQFLTIQYFNEKEGIRKWFVWCYDVVKDQETLDVWLDNFQPSTRQIFDGIAAKAIAWLSGQIGKYGYCITSHSSENSCSTSKKQDKNDLQGTKL